MLQTPYYLLDKAKLIQNMEMIAQLRSDSGAKALLALKCFATWCVFDFMAPYMDGTTSSSLYELQLGRETFGGETHAYSVAWAENEMEGVRRNANKVIFNSINQLTRFAPQLGGLPCGLRLNPGVSVSGFDLADPARPFSRLGEGNRKKIEAILPLITGFMIHNNCENADFESFDRLLSAVEEQFADFFHKVQWVSLGGGIHFTGQDYPRKALAERLKRFANTYEVEVFLEPGEAAITQSTSLEVTVLDTLYNGKDLAIVDSSIEAHMLDLLIYRQSAKLNAESGSHEVMICGKSCLAGDVFGTYHLKTKPQIGDRLSIEDAGGYTMVKKNWFNGVNMPSIVIKELDGSIQVQRIFSYKDFKASLS